MDVLGNPRRADLTAVKTDVNDQLEIGKKLERAFISEMLSFVGMEAISGEFGGGDGEEQFQSFLRDEHAKLIVATGGLGLAEHFANSLKGY